MKKAEILKLIIFSLTVGIIGSTIYYFRFNFLYYLWRTKTEVTPSNEQVSFKRYQPKDLLYFAVTNHDLQLLKRLSAQGIDLNYTIINDDHYTPLYLAIKNNDLEIVNLILANKIDLNFKNSWGQTALFIAVENNNLEIAKLLLNYQINTNINTGEYQDFPEPGNTFYSYDSLLSIAVNNNNTEMVKLLLTQGADPNKGSSSYSQKMGEGYRSEENSILYRAIKKNNVEIIKLLLTQKIDVNSPEIEDSQYPEQQYYCFVDYPLTLAVRANNIEIVKLLLDNGADVNLASSSSFAYSNDEEHLAGTALEIAEKKQNFEMINLIKKYPPVKSNTTTTKKCV
jgi:ankyrin repeat protein